MNARYKVMMVASVLVASSMLSIYAGAGEKGRGERKYPSEGQMAAHRERIEQNRSEIRERFKAEWKRISKLPADEQPAAKAELKERMHKGRKVEGAKKAKGANNAKVQKGKKHRPSDKESAEREEEWAKKVKAIEAKIAQLSPEQQKDAKAKLEKKKRRIRRKAEQAKKNKVTQESVNKLIDEL